MMHGTHNVTLTHCNMMHGTHNVTLFVGLIIVTSCKKVIYWETYCHLSVYQSYSNSDEGQIMKLYVVMKSGFSFLGI